MPLPFVALVGRPNTGKSTLFNAIIKERISIVEDTPGVTRDRIIAKANWKDNDFYLIDTGGIEPYDRDQLKQAMVRQANFAMEMADVIVFVCDAKTALTQTDYDIASMIRKSTKKPCILAVNKIDSIEKEPLKYEFFNLALGEPFSVSAEHGRGLGDLLDAITAHFPREKTAQQAAEKKKIAIVGKPNAGKSTLANLLVGEERMITSSIAGTTRDAIDSDFTYEKETYTLIDTAGIRRKNKTSGNIEFYASVRAMRAIERSDLCLLVIDATQPITEGDVSIATTLQKSEKAIVIVMNKWDLVDKESNTMAKMEKEVRNKLHFLSHCPLVFLSALSKERIHKLMPQVKLALASYETRIPTGVLNEAMSNAVMLSPTPVKGTKRLKVFYSTQVATSPPTIVIFVNDPSLQTDAYTRYLTAKLRESFSFQGSPIKIIYRSSSKYE